MLRPSLVIALGLAAALTPPVAAVDFQLKASQKFPLEKFLVGLNQNFTVEAVIRNEKTEAADSIQGFQMAISHDAIALDFDSATWAGTALAAARNGQGPSFFLPRKVAGAAPGVTLGVIFDQDDLDGFLLPAGDHVVARLTYKAIAATPAGGKAVIGFAARLGDPEVDNKYTIRSGPTLAPAATAGLDVVVSGAPAYAIHFPESDLKVKPGEALTAPIHILNNPLPVFGFSFGVKHLGTHLRFKQADLAPGLTAVIGQLPVNYPFFALNTSPQGGTGFTAALILASNDPTKFLDPTRSPHHVLDVVYDILGGAGSSSALEITGDLGQPKVKVLLDLAGVAQPPIQPAPPRPTTATVTVTSEAGGVPFKRGDVDQNGSVNITDAINILSFLFVPERIADNPVVQDTVASCLVAFNADGSLDDGGAGEDPLAEDEKNIAIADAIYVLSFAFLGGDAPPPPFAACAVNPNPVTPAVLCNRFTCR